MAAEALLPLLAVLAVLAVAVLRARKASPDGDDTTGGARCTWCDATAPVCRRLCDALSGDYAVVAAPADMLNSAWLCAHVPSLGGSALRLELTERYGDELRGTAVASYEGADEARLSARVVALADGVLLVLLHGAGGALEVAVIAELDAGALRGVVLTALEQLGQAHGWATFIRA
jgi:hypothetical protein